jgi:asparagine synthase (glutamine-hydrolysing)
VSRVAGVVALEGGISATRLVDELSARLVRNNWRGARAASGAAAFAHMGWREPVVVAADGELLAVVDGIFYNPEELQGGTIGEGASAAVLLLNAYRRLGFEGALRRINGDFAVALYDASDGSLWLGRDRVGHKPLYYARSGNAFAFASQPRALLALPGLSQSVNRRFAAVFAGSHYRYIDNQPEESPFAAVSQLPAASAMRVKNGAVTVSRYWSLTEQSEFTEDEPTLARQYHDLLLDSVRRRVAALPRPAFTLSGGMDSSSVLSCAVEAVGRKLHAFSSVYTDKTYDESEEIQGFLEHKVERWHPVRIEGFDLFSTVRDMVRAHDEPVATATWLSHFLLCGEVRDAGFETLFGGLGGDELNAGEYEYFIFRFADLARAGQSSALAHEIESWARYHNHPIYRKDRAVAEQAMAHMADFSHPGQVLVDRARLTRYYPAVSRDFYDLSHFEPVLEHPFSSWLKNRTYQDIFRETAPCCLRAEDRDCSAFGLEHADPFFDHRLIEFMFRVPGHMKIRDGITKRLLREAMQGVVPDETRNRVKKTGWNAPAHLWFSRDALSQLLDLVHSPGFRSRGVYDVNEVLRLVREHQEIVQSGAARENHMMFLWQLVNLDLWLQELEAP